MADDKVECMLCGKLFNRIHHKHLSSHGYTTNQYVTEFPSAPLISASTQTKMKAAAVKNNVGRKGVPRDKLIKDKISQTKLSNPADPWNKGKSATTETKSKISQSRIDGFANGQITHWNKGNVTPDDVRDKIAATHRAKHPTKMGTTKTDKTNATDQAFQRHVDAASGMGVAGLEWRPESNSYSAKCVSCGTNITITKQYFRPAKIESRTIGMCPTCYPRNSRSSSGERELFEFISSMFPEAEANNRSKLGGKELDVYIPIVNIGFEYTGNFWHSEQMHKDPKNIFHKMIQADGTRIVFIFEDEWVDKKELVKSRIKQILGVQSTTIGGRKCTINKIDSKQANDFFNAHHIQGADRATYYYGATYDGEIVASMSFKPTNMTKGGDGTVMELSRFAVKQLTHIPGIANRLFSAFTKEHLPEQIISYSDLRWNTGRVYEALGFTLSHTSPPSYWYIRKGGYKRLHRSNYMKHKLVAAGHDINSTERAIMNDLGYLRLWDCGNTVWEWTPP